MQLNRDYSILNGYKLSVCETIIDANKYISHLILTKKVNQLNQFLNILINNNLIMSTISGSINLTALKHVVMEQKGKSGMIQGIFIPLDANHIKLTEKKEVFLNIVGFELDAEKQKYNTHLVKQSFTKEVREKLGDDVIKALPILGNLNAKSSKNEAVNNQAPEQVFTAGADDLPF